MAVRVLAQINKYCTILCTCSTESLGVIVLYCRVLTQINKYCTLLYSTESLVVTVQYSSVLTKINKLEDGLEIQIWNIP